MEKRKRCDKCDSTLVYVRLKSQEQVCRNCGYVSPPKKKKEKKNEIK